MAMRARDGHHPPTILVVDDSPTNLQILIRILAGSGHRILVAKSGRAALEIARRARPDLILLDVLMPDMDGFAVCRAMKADPETREAIVIFLSALGDVSDKVSGLELGAADYITKPFQAEEVLARVSGQLTRQHLERELRFSRDRLARELRNAGAMQRLLLPPTLPVDERVGFWARYRTSLHAGGDYYDVMGQGPGRFAVTVADVAGHGASAAIVMAMIRTVLHSAAGPSQEPGAVLRHLNAHFEYLRPSALFATAIHAVIDAPAGRMTVARAGHLAPLRVRRGTPIEPLSVEGTLPLFVQDLREVPQSTHELRAGDRLLFYTDGVTDQDGPDGTRYEQERLVAALERNAALPPARLLDAVAADVESFAGGREPHDDQTLLLVAVG
jgi:serine phosphatase RsbU (regulator of sigma subunit)